MQDRYVCDVGDFGKYGLLRALVRDDLRLGVVWYLNPAVETNSDGSLVEYLEEGNESGFRECDPELYDALRGLWQTDKRKVCFIQKSGVLPQTTLFYDAPLAFEDLPWAKRKERRTQWCCDAVRTTEKADIVFFDPDNGLPGKTARPYSKNGPKYAFPGELISYAKRGQSLVVYQHRNRTPLSEQVKAGKRSLMNLAEDRTVWALYYHRMQGRIYFLIASVSLETILHKRIREFLNGPWNRHFRPTD